MEENQMKERKEMILSLMNEPSYVPMKIKELAILLEVPKERREELKEVLDALLEEGRILVSKKGKYAKPEILAQKGVFTAHPRGFGFVSIEGREGDVFVAPDHKKDAMDGDTVQVLVTESGRDGRPEAEVLKVLKRANETVIGLFEKNRRSGLMAYIAITTQEDFYLWQKRLPLLSNCSFLPARQPLRPPSAPRSDLTKSTFPVSRRNSMSILPIRQAFLIPA